MGGQAGPDRGIREAGDPHQEPAQVDGDQSGKGNEDGGGLGEHLPQAEAAADVPKVRERASAGLGEVDDRRRKGTRKAQDGDHDVGR